MNINEICAIIGAFILSFTGYHTTVNYFHDKEHTNIRLSIKEELRKEFVSNEIHNQSLKSLEDNLKDLKTDVKDMSTKIDKFLEIIIKKGI